MRVCFVPLCKTGLKTDVDRRRRNGERLLSLFGPPKDPVRFELWSKSMPRVDKKLGPCDNVCELHFKEEDIERYFKKIKLFDGTIYCHRKERASLKENAIPCIFSNVPGHSTYNKKRELLFEETASTRETKKDKKRKVIKKASKKFAAGMEVTGSDETLLSPDLKEYTTEQVKYLPDSIIYMDLTTELESEHIVPIKEKSQEVVSLPFSQSVINAFTTEPEGVPRLSAAEEQHLQSLVNEHLTPNGDIVQSLAATEDEFSFNYLKNNLNMIEKVNSWWTIIAFERFIICARWNLNCTVERKIVIVEDLSVKVSLLERETTIGSDLMMASFNDISKLIGIVERTPICNGVDNKNPNCLGFLQANFVSRRKKLCLNCVKFLKQTIKDEKSHLREEKKIARQHVELLRIHFNC